MKNHKNRGIKKTKDEQKEEKVNRRPDEKWKKSKRGK